MSIRIIVFGRVAPERLTQFKETAAALSRVVVEQEGGATTGYELHSVDAEDCWAIMESYKDGDALRAHMKNVAHLIEPITATLDTGSVAMLGDAPRDMIELFESFGNFTYYGNTFSAV